MAIDPAIALTDVVFAPALKAFVTRSPALTRLEPQSVSGDPTPGAEAVIADPLWMIGRQWQFGELLGEDAGSPVSVRVTSRSLPVTAWAPAGRMDGTDDVVAAPTWQAWPEGAVLDELVEDVPRDGYDHGLRWRAESGAALTEAMAEAGHTDVVDLLLAAHPLDLAADPLDPTGLLDRHASELLLTLAGAVPDGALAHDAVAAGTPSWLTAAADPAGAAAVTQDWRAWFDGAAHSGGAWTTTRLEHRFRLRFGRGDDAVVVAADAFAGGPAHWADLAWLPDETVTLDGDDQVPVPAERTATLLATPLRYPGMPSDRYWQFEDASIDVAAIEAQPHDLARLCLAEFAVSYGDDWLVVPVDGEIGAIHRVSSVVVRTTFGEEREIQEASETRRGRGFRMFEVTAADGRALDGLLLTPVAATPLLGPEIETVAFVRDETANLAWAIESVVPGRTGDGRQRRSEVAPTRPEPMPDRDPEDVVYLLQTPVPKHWIPLVPVRTGPATTGLRKGAMLADGEPIQAASLLLRPTPLTFPPEEIPREGVTVRAVPALARRRDGTYARWVGHRVTVGRGEASSGYAADTATLPKPPAPRPPVP